MQNRADLAILAGLAALLVALIGREREPAARQHHVAGRARDDRAGNSARPTCHHVRFAQDRKAPQCALVVIAVGRAAGRIRAGRNEQQ
jgi:hypothetical protein